MKRAKLMLSAIAIVGVLGGAFAFKAAKFIPITIYTGSLLGGNQKCTTALTAAAIADHAVGSQLYASTASNNTNCPVTYTRTAE